MSPKCIECFIDIVSPYSYFAFTYLLENREALRSFDVEVEFIPVFLGGINQNSGNKPPWTLPAKAAYAKFDGERARLYFGKEFETPSFFPIVSLLPQRSLVYIKSTHSASKFEDAFLALFAANWEKHLDTSKPDQLRTALADVFPTSEIETIVAAAGTPEVKEMLNSNTTRAWKDCGAFGAPWFWVTDGRGVSEPFFGSDRWGYMWRFLGLPFQDVRLKAKV